MTWWIVIVAASGALPVAGRLWTMGPDARRGALVITVASLAGAVALRTLRSPAGPIAAGAVLVVAILATQGTIGRAPAPVAASLIALAHVLLPSGRSTRTDRLERTGLAPVLWIVGAAWWIWGSNVITLIGVVALTAAALVADRRPATLAPLVPVGRAVDGWPAGVEHILQRLRAGTGRSVGAIGVWAADGAGWVRGRDRGQRVAVLAAAIAGVLVAPIFWRLAVDQQVFIRGINDLNSGYPRIEYLQVWPPRMPAAHPVWLVTIHMLMWGTSYAVATTLVSCLAIAASVLVLVALARSRWDDRPALAWPAAIVFGIGWLFLESASVLLPRGDQWWARAEPLQRFASGATFLPLHLWAVPTLVMSLPLAFSAPPLVLRLIHATDRADPRAPRWGRALLVHTVVFTLLLPATTLAYAPAAALYLLLTGRLRRAHVLGVGRWYVLPAALVVLGQVAFLHSKVSPYEQATWLWRPFWAIHHYNMDRPAAYGIVLFLLACWWLGGRRYARDPAVGLGLLALLVSLPPVLFLRQTTVAPIPDADLAVPMCMAVLLLFIASLRFAAIELLARPAGAAAPRRFAAAAVVACLALMVVAGTWDLGSAAGWLQES